MEQFSQQTKKSYIQTNISHRISVEKEKDNRIIGSAMIS